MKRIVVVVVVLVLSVGGALAWKIRAEAEALSGPPGGSGVVEATTVDLASKVVGRVTKVAVRRGDRVTEGQLLMELDCADVEAAVAQAEAQAAAARAQAEGAAAGIDASERGVSALRAAARSAGERVGALETRLEHAGRDAERVESLGEHASASRRDGVRATTVSLDREVAAARTSVAASRHQAAAAAAQTRVAEAGAEAAARAADAAEAAAARARLMLAECRVVAPLDATVDNVFFEVGELPRPGAPLVRLADLRVVTATFYLPNAELGAVRVGQRARVEADAFPGRPVEGEVTTIGVEAEFTPRNVQTRTDRDRLVFPIEVRIRNEGSVVLLRPGMPVQVTLLGGGR